MTLTTTPLAPADRDDLAQAREVHRLIGGAMVSRALYAACRLRIPDLCADQPRTAEELGAIAGADPDALGRVLRLLAGEGVFIEDDDGCFHLTARGELLCRDRVGTQWHLAVLLPELIEPTPEAALFAVRTGGSAFEHAHGCALYPHLAAHPDAEALFAEAMTARAACLHAQVIEAVDWTGVHHVVDVGGNHGGFLAAILGHLPAATGLLFDQPQVVAGAAAALDAAGVADRVDVEGGSFFEAVPPGGDLYLVANVLWNWDDDGAGRILRRCRDAMAPSARLLICEPVIPPGNGQHAAKLLDLGNFWLNGGRTRTLAAWRALLEGAGFDLVQIAETELEWSVLEARPRS
ncbi:MAG TPA: methyltransferase [Acidimicrobiales bacterium]|nr:methyltransferase [Acidimicrobiales bacterium]